MRKECRLRLPGKIMVDYPADFQGQKSEENAREKAFFVSSEPRWLTTDEIDLVAKFLLKYNKGQDKSQSLIYTDAVLIDPTDPLLTSSHGDLDRIEQANGLPNSQYSTAGGRRSLYERVLIIRERGCFANAASYLNPMK